MSDRFKFRIPDEDDEIYEESSEFAQGAETQPLKHMSDEMKASLSAADSDDDDYEQNSDFSKVLEDIEKAFAPRKPRESAVTKPVIPEPGPAPEEIKSEPVTPEPEPVKSEPAAPTPAEETPVRDMTAHEKMAEKNREVDRVLEKIDEMFLSPAKKSQEPEQPSEPVAAKPVAAEPEEAEPVTAEPETVGTAAAEPVTEPEKPDRKTVENMDKILSALDKMTETKDDGITSFENKEEKILSEEEAEDAKNAELITSIADERGITPKEEFSARPVKRKSFSEISHGLTGKISTKTEEFDRAEIPDDASFEQKSDFLERHRRKKVENFVLDSERQEEEWLEELEREEEEELRAGRRLHNMDEFKRFEDAPKVLADILEIKNNLFIRLCILMFTSVSAIFITLANDMEWPIIKTFDRTISPSAYLFTLTILGLISIAVTYNVMVKGIKNMFLHRPDCDSLAALSIFSAVIVGIANLFDPESVRSSFYHVYTSVAILGLMINTLGKFMIIRRTERNFRYVAGDFERYAVKSVSDSETAENFTRGMTETAPKIAAVRKTEFVDGFVKNSYTPDVSDEYAKKMSYPILIAAIAIAVLSLFFDKGATNKTERLFVALEAFSGVISICASVASMLIVNVPLARATKKYLQYSAVMLGYSSVKDFADTNTVLADSTQLFPEGMIELTNLKIMSTVSIEDCILNAASLACQAGSVLTPTFYKILKGKTELLYPVESYIFEDGMGLSGWIDNRRVLLGTRELMENHSIDGLPTLSKEAEYAGNNTVIYLSISGIVCAMFSVSVSASLAVSKWMQELEKEGISIVVRSVDGFITKDLVSRLFGVSTESIRLLSFRYNEAYEKETAYAPREASSMLCSGRFPSLAMLIIGAKRLSFSTKLGAAVLSSAALLGIVISAIMMLAGSFVQISASFVIVYNLAVTACALLIQHIKRF